jgi:predicted aconitase with swiveling domain/8-oxo-dGTP pyrophosphatase MutT (NUDIX family)
MRLSGRKIRGGSASGKAIVCACPISFLGGIDPLTGKILDEECECKGQSVSGRIFCFPFGKGSTVGSYSLYQLRLNKKAPLAIINSSAEPIVATGAIIAEVPMVDGIDVSLLRTGDRISVNADEGSVDLNVVEKHVVTCIVRNGARILLLQRSNKVGSYRGHWAGVSGFVENGETDETAARREMREEIGREKARLAKHLETQCFRDGEVIWCVHPFLFDVKDRRVRTDWEHQAVEWIDPDEVKRYTTVPGLSSIVSKLL